MTDYLYKIAEENNYTITYHKTHCTKSFVVEFANEFFINLDEKSIGSSEEMNVCLAHELGHCLSGTVYTINHTKLYRGSAEYRADYRAALLLIPVDKLVDCIKKGNYELYAIAEYFNTTEEFVARTITIYKNKGLLNRLIYDL